MGMGRLGRGMICRLAFVAGGLFNIGGVAWADATYVSTFYDRDLLTATVLRNEQVAVQQAEAQLAAAVAAYEHARTSLEALRAWLDAMPADDPNRADKLTEAASLQKVMDGPLADAVASAKAAWDAAQMALAQEQASVPTWRAALKDGQVFAFNRALNTAMAANLVVRLNAAEMQAAIDGSYGSRQIGFLVKALMEEARFLARAEAFHAKALETHESRYLEVAERMRRRAAEQKIKFLSRIQPAEAVSSKVVNISTLPPESVAQVPAQEQGKTVDAVQEQRMLAHEAVLENRAAARAAAQEARAPAPDSAYP